MITAFCLIITMIILQELGSIHRQRVHHSPGQSIRTVPRIFRALSIELLTQFVTCIGIHWVKIAIGIHTAHIIHGYRNRCLDSGIDSRCIECHTTPSANTQNTNTLCIHIVTNGQKIHCCTKIFRVNIGRSHITGFSITFSGIRRIEGNRQKTTLRQGLCI